MVSVSAPDPLSLEIATLRHDIGELRREQQEMRVQLDELVKTFKALAIHLGIASEPYRKNSGETERSRDLPGFA
jgi:hypothetical protein